VQHRLNEIDAQIEKARTVLSVVIVIIA